MPRKRKNSWDCRDSNYRTPTQVSWMMMRQRVGNPNANGYDRYGGRGITICERWQVYENFLADMGERPEGKTLDRIDPDGPYCPANCRWATAAEQSANRRKGWTHKNAQNRARSAPGSRSEPLV